MIDLPSHHEHTWPPEPTAVDWEARRPNLAVTCRDGIISIQSTSSQHLNRVAITGYLILIGLGPLAVTLAIPAIVNPSHFFPLIPVEIHVLISVMVAGRWWVLLTLGLMAFLLISNNRMFRRTLTFDTHLLRLKVDNFDWLSLAPEDEIEIVKRIGAGVSYSVVASQRSPAAEPKRAYLLRHWNLESAELIAAAIRGGLHQQSSAGIIVENFDEATP